MWSTARSEAALEAALPLPIEIRPMRNARRMRLRVDDAGGMLKLTCPWRTSRRAALAWALDQRGWIDQQLARAAPVLPFEPGAVIPIEGRDTRIAWDEAAPRTPRLGDSETVMRRPGAMACRGGSKPSSSGLPSTPCRGRWRNMPKRPE